MKMFPAYSLDIQYDLYPWLRFYLNHGRNMHPMAQQTPAAMELKLATAFEYKGYDASVDVDLTDGTLGGIVGYRLTKEIKVEACLSFNPLAKWSKKNTKFFRNFGFGVKYESNSMEDLMKEEEDLSEYEYDKL
jgi:hypothetical protein